jgi:hypothetical protein
MEGIKELGNLEDIIKTNWEQVKEFVKKYFASEIDINKLDQEKLPPIIVRDRRKIYYATEPAKQYIDLVEEINKTHFPDIKEPRTDLSKFLSLDYDTLFEKYDFEKAEKMSFLRTELVTYVPIHYGHCNYLLDYLITYRLENGKISEGEGIIVHEMLHRVFMKYGTNEEIRERGGDEYFIEYLAHLVLAENGKCQLSEINPNTTLEGRRYRAAREKLRQFKTVEEALKNLKQEYQRQEPILSQA